MTEIERIISEGFLKPSFFEEEYLCDYFVDTKAKKAWAIELDLLYKFAMVCKKHNLKWCLIYGTLLGAIRHKGFIPWDDDIDVAMPRDDYERLLKIDYEFENPYFLQTPYSDNGYFFSFAKLRNSNTSMINEKFINQGYNQGIMLDIFPLDKWDKTKGKDIFTDINNLVLKNSTYMRLTTPEPDENDIKRIGEYDGADPFETYEKIQELSKQFACEDVEHVCIPVLTTYGYERNVFKLEDFSSYISLSFEKIECPVPCGYDRILKTIYGDYMKMPPIEERGKWHSFLIDPDKSYKDCLAK